MSILWSARIRVAGRTFFGANKKQAGGNHKKTRGLALRDNSCGYERRARRSVHVRARVCVRAFVYTCRCAVRLIPCALHSPRGPALLVRARSGVGVEAEGARPLVFGFVLVSNSYAKPEYWFYEPSPSKTIVITSSPAPLYLSPRFVPPSPYPIRLSSSANRIPPFLQLDM